MPDILVRDLDASVVKRLKSRAKADGRSLQSEVKLIIERGADAPKVNMKKARELIDRICIRFKGRKFPDSVELIRKGRDR